MANFAEIFNVLISKTLVTMLLICDEGPIFTFLLFFCINTGKLSTRFSCDVCTRGSTVRTKQYNEEEYLQGGPN